MIATSTTRRRALWVSSGRRNDHAATREALGRTGLAELKRIVRDLNAAGFDAWISMTSHDTGSAFDCTLTVEGVGEVPCALGVRMQILIAQAQPPFSQGEPLEFNIGDRAALGKAVEQWALEHLTLDRRR
ncbi:hypothetical protein [Deinococcus hohokamensis]|uniref:Uncharacterized protein n=1 Tax=Deinococcus hohokamensis TaxID=309883 RepID=A0ABV9I6C4_9DEIO